MITFLSTLYIYNIIQERNALYKIIKTRKLQKYKIVNVLAIKITKITRIYTIVMQIFIKWPNHTDAVKNFTLLQFHKIIYFEQEKISTPKLINTKLL